MRNIYRPKRSMGFSLIELMIAVTLGLVVLSAITAVMISTTTTNSANLNMIRLDQDLRNIMLLMTRDIRRAGSWSNASADVQQNQNTNLFMQVGTDIVPTPANPTSPATSSSANSNCALFTYDLNSNGMLETANPDERFGFRLNSGAIQMRNGAATCNDTGWENITDPSIITITDLSFTVNATWGDITGTALLPGDSGYVDGTDAQIVVRDVTVSVTGEINIGGGQTAQRTIQQNVRVRNDRYIPAQ